MKSNGFYDMGGVRVGGGLGLGKTYHASEIELGQLICDRYFRIMISNWMIQWLAMMNRMSRGGHDHLVHTRSLSTDNCGCGVPQQYDRAKEPNN